MVILSERDKEMLAGRNGSAAELAMSILVEMAEVLGAPRMMDITEAHLDVCHYSGEASLEIPEIFAGMGAKFAVPTTLNTSSIDLRNWKRFGVPDTYAAKVKRMESSFSADGAIPTWTCAPYHEHLAPRYGQQIAWAESNAINYANSVIGARTARYGDYMEMCAAITGRVPECGLQLKENRKGQVLVKLQELEPRLLTLDAMYPVLGYLVGKLVQERIPVIDGIPRRVSKDQLKTFSAAAASSGSVALFHMVGVTPEADTLEDAFQGGEPSDIIEIRRSDVQEAHAALSTITDGKLDVVAVGCPHYSVPQLARLATLMQGEHVHSDVQFIVISNRAALHLLEGSGVVDALSEFGAALMADCCIVGGPIVKPHARVLMTDSGKWAYYCSGNPRP